MARGRKKQTREDAFEKLGNNAAGVLKGHVEKIEKKLSAIHGIRKEIKTLKNAAKKDGFSAKALDEVIKLRAIETSIRIAHEEEVMKMKKALAMPDLFEFAEQQDRFDGADGDADDEAGR